MILLQKINTRIILICSAFMLISCSKEYNPNFFNGEWISDSLTTGQNDHWREFLYFNKSHVARTTIWGKQYLLNKNLRIKGLKLYERNRLLFNIKVIDSNKIIVKGKDYYGSFYRDDSQLYDMKTIVSLIEETESKRKKIIGNWKAVDFKIISISKYPEDKIYAEFPENTKIAEVPTNEIKSVNFDYNQFSFHYKDRVVSFGYTAEKDKIEFGSGDVIFSFNYHFQNNQLIIDYTTHKNILNTITFEKIK